MRGWCVSSTWPLCPWGSRTFWSIYVVEMLGVMKVSPGVLGIFVFLLCPRVGHRHCLYICVRSFDWHCGPRCVPHHSLPVLVTPCPSFFCPSFLCPPLSGQWELDHRGVRLWAFPFWICLCPFLSLFPCSPVRLFHYRSLSFPPRSGEMGWLSVQLAWLCLSRSEGIFVTSWRC